MKYLAIFSVLISTFLLFPSCEEVGPTIEFEAPLVDTSFISTVIPPKQSKVVVIEDFSGVQCVNCPIGNETVSAILEALPGQAIGLTVHGGDLAVPYPNSTEDFVSDETQELNTFMGIVGWPAATFDRVPFDGQEFLFVLGQFSNWQAFAESRLTEQPIVNIDLKNTWDEESRTVTTEVTSVYTEGDPDPHKLSVFLVESHIIDPQLAPEGKIDDYEHNHVVRDMFTIATGTALSADAPVAGLTVAKTFQLENIPTDYDMNNSYVVAMVHRSGESREVLQGVEKSIID